MSQAAVMTPRIKKGVEIWPPLSSPNVFVKAHNMVQQLIWKLVVTYAGGLMGAGIYTLLWETFTPMTNFWHHAVATVFVRHLIRNVGEGFFARLCGKLVTINPYKVRAKPSDKLSKLDRFEKARGIPNRSDHKEFSVGRVFKLAYAFLYAVPGFVLIALVLVPVLTNGIPALGFHGISFTSLTDGGASGTSFGKKMLSLVTQGWQLKLAGYGATFLFGLRPALPVFVNIQDWIIKRGIDSGWESVPWFMPITFIARFNQFYASEEVFDIHMSKWAVLTLKALGIFAIGLIGLGFYVLTFKA